MCTKMLVVLDISGLAIRFTGARRCMAQYFVIYVSSCVPRLLLRWPEFSVAERKRALSLAYALTSMHIYAFHAYTASLPLTFMFGYIFRTTCSKTLFSLPTKHPSSRTLPLQARKLKFENSNFWHPGYTKSIQS